MCLRKMSIGGARARGANGTLMPTTASTRSGCGRAMFQTTMGPQAGPTNAVVGDIEGNAALIRGLIDEARDEGAQLVVFPELALTGYPPEDLLLKTHFADGARAALEELAGAARDIVALVGFPERADDLYNAAAVLADGQLRAVYRKMFLPNYGVFDEHRYFQE